jgi:hypothetical protein
MADTRPSGLVLFCLRGLKPDYHATHGSHAGRFRRARQSDEHPTGFLHRRLLEGNRARLSRKISSTMSSA